MPKTETEGRGKEECLKPEKWRLNQEGNGRVMSNVTRKGGVFMIKKIFMGLGIVFVLLILVGIFSSGESDKKQAVTAPQAQQSEKQPSKPPANKPSVNMAEFEQIKSGMTYEEVKNIIGGPGQVLSESGNPGEQFHTVMYQYEGEGSLGANANFMFQGGKLVNKAQFGLK